MASLSGANHFLGVELLRARQQSRRVCESHDQQAADRRAVHVHEKFAQDVDPVGKVGAWLCGRTNSASFFRVSNVEDQALQNLVEKFTANKSRLMKEFALVDVENTGNVN